MISIPGITRIGYVSAEALPVDIVLRAAAGVPVAIYAADTRVSLIGDAVCETETQFDNNAYTEKVTLSFSTTDVVPTTALLAFIVTTVQGTSYVIGSKDGPYPTIKAEATTGTPDGDKAVTKYTISYQNRLALVVCYT